MLTSAVEKKKEEEVVKGILESKGLLFYIGWS